MAITIVSILTIRIIAVLVIEALIIREEIIGTGTALIIRTIREEVIIINYDTPDSNNNRIRYQNPSNLGNGQVLFSP